MRGWWNTVGNLIERLWFKKHVTGFDLRVYANEKTGGTVSSNSRFQTVLFQHNSAANLSSDDAAEKERERERERERDKKRERERQRERERERQRERERNKVEK